MRRLLDPRVPNPSWLRFAYRIVLGGFAGIIVVWFWTPSSPKLAQPEFATLTSFGLAFLVGFSTDVFFQGLDRLVSYLSQAVGQAGTHQAG
jgi:xanthine/uracil permease